MSISNDHTYVPQLSKKTNAGSGNHSTRAKVTATIQLFSLCSRVSRGL